MVSDDCVIPNNVFQVGETIKKMPGGDGTNPFSQLVEDAEGLDKIESLQDHPNEDLYEKAVHILEIYFDADDGGEDQNLAPSANANEYAFGAPSAVPAFAQAGAPMPAFNFGSSDPSQSGQAGFSFQ